MRVLIVASGNSGKISPFVSEQLASINEIGIVTDYFLVKGIGMKGYIKNLPSLKKYVKQFKPDIIHAHYGLCGLLANLLLLKIPVITTFHGSDINNKKTRFFSRIAYSHSKKSIFVSSKLAAKINAKKSSIIPCGVNTNTFKPIDKLEARKKIGIEQNEVFALFSASFTNPVKNFDLANKAIKLIPNITLKELKGYTREDVSLLMNASDLVLLTSFTEGSPQFIKEAMACNTPIVSTDVGDVKYLLNDLESCYLTSFNPDDVAEKIKLAMNSNKTKGRMKLIELGLDSKTIAERITTVYKEVLNK